MTTAVFEETFIPYPGYAMEYAPVDTNAEVYVGCHSTELLAIELGKISDSLHGCGLILAAGTLCRRLFLVNTEKITGDPDRLRCCSGNR